MTPALRLGPLAAVLVLGYLFLYAPIVSLIVYSFNASRLVTVWAGFSTRWYGELLYNDAIRDAASLSLEIAADARSRPRRSKATKLTNCLARALGFGPPGQRL